MPLISRQGDESPIIDRLSATLCDFSQLEAVMSDFHDILDEGASRPVVVGVSGGGDSVALLALLCLWGRRELVVAHVDHGLQDQSAEWAGGVKALCQSLGLRYYGLKWANPAKGPGVSNAARLARHRLLAEVAREVGASVIALGHNLDDAREAVWMRAQGSNTGTARRFAPSPVWPEGRGVFLYRPQIDIGRATLRDWLRASGVSYLDDPSNADPKYLRSRARMALKVQSDTAYLPEVVTNAPVIDAATYEALALEPERFAPFGVIALRPDELKALKSEQVHKVLAVALVASGGGETLPSAARVDALLEWLDTSLGAGKIQKRTLSGALCVRTAEAIYFGRDIGDARLKRRNSGLEPMTLDEGQIAVWDGRFEIKALKLLTIYPNIGLGLMRSGALTPEMRAGLMALPADLRRGLPVALEFGDDKGRDEMNARSLALWENYSLALYSEVVRVRSLVASRFQAGLGLITREP